MDDIKKIYKASQQKGVRFNLNNGTYISIQQNALAYCGLKHDDDDDEKETLTSCEVGIFYDGDDDNPVVIGFVSPENLVTLLDCAVQGKEIPEELLKHKI